VPFRRTGKSVPGHNYPLSRSNQKISSAIRCGQTWTCAKPTESNLSGFIFLSKCRKNHFSHFVERESVPGHNYPQSRPNRKISFFNRSGRGWIYHKQAEPFSSGFYFSRYPEIGKVSNFSKSNFDPLPIEISTFPIFPNNYRHSEILYKRPHPDPTMPSGQSWFFKNGPLSFFSQDSSWPTQTQVTHLKIFL